MSGSPPSPTQVSTSLPDPPEEAFRLLEDPAAFEKLVAGARKVRHFDTRWPEEGTRLHHTLGVPPLLLRDNTEVLANSPGRRLLLQARARPLGVFEVEFSFEPEGTGCRLTVTERPIAGPVLWPGIRRLTRLGLELRNREICRRYHRLTGARRQARGRSVDA